MRYQLTSLRNKSFFLSSLTRTHDAKGLACSRRSGSGEWRHSLRASSPIWASEASFARTRERPPRSRVLARLISLTQIGELARRLVASQQERRGKEGGGGGIEGIEEEAEERERERSLA